MRAERPILLRFLNVLTSLNGFIIKRIVFLFLVKYIASGTLRESGTLLISKVIGQWSRSQGQIVRLGDTPRFALPLFLFFFFSFPFFFHNFHKFFYL